MILLVGATGLLGHNVLELLLRQGRRVRCIVREGSSIDSAVTSQAIEGQLDIVTGSILDESLLERCIGGCNEVVNCAGVTDMSHASIDDYRPVNTWLPLKLAELLDAGSGGTLVDVSTANTVEPGTAGHPSDEDSPFGGPFSASLYARSKRESERALMEFAQTHLRTRVVILMPGFMIGPYDRKPSSGKLLLTAYRKPLMAVPAGGKSFIDARDVASAVAGALSNPLTQGRYLTTGKALSLKEFYNEQKAVCGYRQLCLTLPRWLCLWVGGLGDWLEKHGKRNLFTSRNVRQLLVMEYYDDSRARRELGMTCTPLQQSIKDFFDYNER